MGKIALSQNAQNGKTEGFCVIRSIEIKKSTAGSPYLDLSLGDNQGEIRSKLWDYKADVHGVYHLGDIVKVRGRISQWQGSEQLTVDLIRKATEEDQVPMEELVPSAPANTAEMYDRLFSLAEGFKDEDLKLLTCHLLSKNKLMLLRYPAALKLHHSVRGGLLYHTTSLVELAIRVCEVYPALDRDLLLCGAILHDIAKIREMEIAQSGLASGYSTAGQLLGHLVMGAQDAAQTAKELNVPREKTLLVQHMILSHHGEPEFGAAVRPLCAEAELLSYIDMIDSRMEIYEETLASVPAGSFSGRVFALEKHIYKHN